MGRIRRLILGNKDEDIGVLKKKYGLPPSKYISLPNGLTVHVRDEGDSKALPIVLVHGHSEDMHTWNKLAEKLVENFRVIRFDLRRHGLTGPAPDNEYNLENYVADLSLLIDNLGIGSFVLIGHSMGGRISILSCKDYHIGRHLTTPCHYPTIKVVQLCQSCTIYLSILRVSKT